MGYLPPRLTWLGPDISLKLFDQHFGIASALVVLLAAGWRQVVRCAFSKAGLGLEIGESLSREGEEFVETQFAGFVLNELNHLASDALIFVGGIDVEAGEFRLGGIGDIVAREIAKRTGKETRCCVLGHLQRGGAPTTLDRILATRFGVKAVQLANEGHFGSMVSYHNYQVRHVPIAEAVNRLKLVPPNGEIVQTARDVDISFGD